MALDWFTLVAQIINFLVLVLLLKHLFYGRIIEAINAREAKISGSLEAAARERASAKHEAGLFRTRNREFDEQRQQMLAQATDEVEAQRRQLLDDARREAEKAQGQWLKALEREQKSVLQDVRERLGQGVFALASQALKELADAPLEEQVLKVFIERVRTLAPAERETLVEAVRSTPREVEIHTAFPIGAQAQQHLTDSLRQYVDDSIELRFTVVPELICGIELRAHSHRLSWNLDSYLTTLEARVSEVLEESVKSHAATR